MFYLTMPSTHFIYDNMVSGICPQHTLFMVIWYRAYALNTFYLWLYGVNHVVKDYSDSQRKPAATITWATLFE